MVAAAFASSRSGNFLILNRSEGSDANSERPPDFRKTHPKLASVLGEVGIESLDRVHGREPSFLGRDVSEIERLLVSSNLGMLAHAWWPPGEATPDCILDQSVEVLELNARSSTCLSNAGIRTIRDLLRQSDYDLLHIKNLGRKSLREIREKLAIFQCEGGLPPPEIHIEPGWFPLAALLSFEALGIPTKTTRILRQAGVDDVHDLLIRSPSEIQEAFLSDSRAVFVLAQGRALAFNVATGSRLWATDEFTSFAFFKTFGRAAVTRNGHFDLEWRDASSGEVIAIWGKRDGGFASNVVMAGGNVLVEISDNSHRGDGLRLLRVPDALKQRLSNATKRAMR